MSNIKIPTREFFNEKKVKYNFLSVTDIINELKKEGVRINRATFIRLEKEGLFMSRRTPGGWRRYSKAEASVIIHMILTEYAAID